MHSQSPPLPHPRIWPPPTQVQEHFKSYNLLNDRVLFHKGFFRDSLPTAPVSQLAVIRADGDMYESTMDILFNLYEKLSVGGYVVIDDWGIPVAQEAVWDFAKWHGFTEDVKNLVSGPPRDVIFGRVLECSSCLRLLELKIVSAEDRVGKLGDKSWRSITCVYRRYAPGVEKFVEGVPYAPGFSGRSACKRSGHLLGALD